MSASQFNRKNNGRIPYFNCLLTYNKNAPFLRRAFRDDEKWIANNNV